MKKYAIGLKQQPGEREKGQESESGESFGLGSTAVVSIC